MSSILELVEYDENSITGLVAKQDFGRLGGKKFKGDDIGNQDVEGYYRFVYEGNSYKVHKVIYELIRGEIPEGFIVDHLNGDTSDNNISNLRLVDTATNAKNRKKSIKCKTGITGVSFNEKRNKWSSTWVDMNGVRVQVSFSVSVYGDKARQMAIEARVKGVNDCGNYTERHGK